VILIHVNLNVQSTELDRKADVA